MLCALECWACDNTLHGCDAVRRHYSFQCAYCSRSFCQTGFQQHRHQNPNAPERSCFVTWRHTFSKANDEEYRALKNHHHALRRREKMRSAAGREHEKRRKQEQECRYKEEAASAPPRVSGLSKDDSTSEFSYLSCIDEAVPVEGSFSIHPWRRCATLYRF